MATGFDQGHRRSGPLRGEPGVADGPLRLAQRRGCAPVASQVSDVGIGLALEGVGDGSVEPEPAGDGESVVASLSDEGVGEREAHRATRNGDDEARLLSPLQHLGHG